MPQMAPLWWLILMLMFLIIYLIFMSIIFYEKKYNVSMNYNLIYKNMFWVW